MHRLRLAATFALTTLALAAGSLFAVANVSAASDGKVQICHFTSSEHNQFVVINISTNALEKHLALHGNPVNGQGDDGLYDPITETCLGID